MSGWIHDEGDWMEKQKERELDAYITLAAKIWYEAGRDCAEAVGVPNDVPWDGLPAPTREVVCSAVRRYWQSGDLFLLCYLPVYGVTVRMGLFKAVVDSMACGVRVGPLGLEKVHMDLER